MVHEAMTSANVNKETIFEGTKPVDMRLGHLSEESFDCPLCQSLLYEPITTSCGHTFCKQCILRAMDHDNKCPMCRTVIHVTPEYGVSVILAQIIKQSFPEIYRQRQQERDNELQQQHFNMPLFLLGQLILYPKAALPLHVFEPRYRLMIRRCLEGGHRFGIVPFVNNTLATIGCTAFIESHHIFPDGRSLITTTGEKRFRVLSVWDQDGYKVAKIEYFDDEPLTEDSTNRLQEKFRLMKELVLSRLSNALPKIEEKIGKMPQANAVDFAWWLSAVVPISVEEKVTLLGSRSAEQRLDLLSSHINNMFTASSNDSNCTIS